MARSIQGLAGQDGLRSGAAVSQIAIACGRVSVPYIRALHPERAAGADLFAVCPAGDCRAISGPASILIWKPEHDSLAGRNVISTLTSPIRSRRRAWTPRAPIRTPRLASLPAPRAAILLGGRARAHEFFAPADIARLPAGDPGARIAGQGYSVDGDPVAGARRPNSSGRCGKVFGDAPAFVWDGAGANPYAQMSPMPRRSW